MKLFSLLKNIKCRVFGTTVIEIDGLYHNDKEVENNGLFFCLKGEKNDGKKFIDDAIKNGAVAIVCQNEISEYKNITQIIVADVRKTMSVIACNFYDNPAKKLKIIGVTGTNGKTTITYMCHDLVSSFGKNCAIIGTNGVIYNDKKIITNMTTPDPIELQKILKILVKNNVEFVFIEVSAHAIFLSKIEGIIFELIIFTNLTEDHLDYFKTMQNYFDAKRKIFTKNHTKKALINFDDEFGKILYESINLEKYSYAINKKSNYKAENLILKKGKQEFCFYNQKISSSFLGDFNVSNLLAAISCCDLLGFDISNIQKSIEKLHQVPGRFNCFFINNVMIVIDYAHTLDGMKNVLNLCKNIIADKKIFCVFGCGGNRETQKRAKMGEISSIYADFTIITADNSRFEKKEDIANEIKSGIIGSNYIIILDRKDAIEYAFKNAKMGDLILVAGKGAEDYIEENGIKKKYSDFEVVKYLEKKYG